MVTTNNTQAAAALYSAVAYYSFKRYTDKHKSSIRSDRRCNATIYTYKPETQLDKIPGHEFISEFVLAFAYAVLRGQFKQVNLGLLAEQISWGTSILNFAVPVVNLSGANLLGALNSAVISRFVKQVVDTDLTIKELPNNLQSTVLFAAKFLQLSAYTALKNTFDNKFIQFGGAMLMTDLFYTTVKYITENHTLLADSTEDDFAKMLKNLRKDKNGEINKVISKLRDTTSSAIAYELVAMACANSKYDILVTFAGPMAEAVAAIMPTAWKKACEKIDQYRNSNGSESQRS